MAYYAVIFTSTRTSGDHGYSEMAEYMATLAKKEKGYLGIESARDSELGITVSYWESLDAIKAWKQNSEHQIAQKLGKEKWYKHYHLRIAKVEEEYTFTK